MKNTFPKRRMLVLTAAILAVLTVEARAEIYVATDNPGYLRDYRGVVVMSGTGLCVRSGTWTPANAIRECDPDAMPKVAAVSPTPAPAASATPAVEKVIVTADTLFDFDQSVIKPAGRDILDNLVAKLESNNRVVISTGHTDSTGSDKYNMDLSQRRTEAVKAYLVTKHIDSNRIQTKSGGERDPVADNATAQGRTDNRRVEIEVMTTAK